MPLNYHECCDSIPPQTPDIAGLVKGFLHHWVSLYDAGCWLLNPDFWRNAWGELTSHYDIYIRLYNVFSTILPGKLTWHSLNKSHPCSIRMVNKFIHGPYFPASHVTLPQSMPKKNVDHKLTHEMKPVGVKSSFNNSLLASISYHDVLCIGMLPRCFCNHSKWAKLKPSLYWLAGL